MQQVFQYPMTYPWWWLDNYYLFTWFLGMLFLAVGWGVFFRYGKFSYGIDFGCLWKSLLLLLMTTIALGAPSFYNTRFIAEHGQEGDVVTLNDEKLTYNFRKGEAKTFGFEDIVKIYKERDTFNPPPKFFVVAKTGESADSVFVTENLPGYEKMLTELSALSEIPFER